MGYYRRWFIRAFASVWVLLAAFSTIVTFLVPVASHFWPRMAITVTSLAWQIPLALCGTFFLGRIILAPYWLWRDDITEASRLRVSNCAAIADRDAQLSSLRRLDPQATVTQLSDYPPHFMLLVHFENPGERTTVRRDWRLTVIRSGAVIAQDIRGTVSSGTGHILEAGAPSDVWLRFPYDAAIPDMTSLTGAEFSLVGSDIRNHSLQATFPPQLS